MTYQPNRPQAGDRISQSQVDLETNFQQLNIGFGVNHNAYDAANAGEHTKVTITTPLAADPVLANPAGMYYTKAVSAVTQAFFEHTTTLRLCDHAVVSLDRDLNAFLSCGSDVLFRAVFS